MSALARLSSALNREITADDFRSLLQGFTMHPGAAGAEHALVVSSAGSAPSVLRMPGPTKPDQLEWDPVNFRFGPADDQERVRGQARDQLCLLRVDKPECLAFDALVPGDVTSEARDLIASNFSSWAPYAVDEVFFQILATGRRGNASVISVAYAPKARIAPVIDAVGASGLTIDGLVFCDAAALFLFDRSAPLKKGLRRNRNLLLGISAALLGMAALIAWDHRQSVAQAKMRAANTATVDTIRVLKAAHESLPEPDVWPATPSGIAAFLGSLWPPAIEPRKIELAGNVVRIAVDAAAAARLIAALQPYVPTPIQAQSVPNAAMSEIAIRVEDIQ